MQRRPGGSGAPAMPRPAGFWVVWTTVALDLVGFGIVMPILPLYSARLGASPAVIGALVAAFSAAQLALAPVWGRLSDRIGRKPVLVASLVGTAAGSLLTGLAGGLVLLFLGRIVDGASGGSIAAAQATVADTAPAGQRARLMGLLGAAFGIGFVAGPGLAGITALVSPRLPFFLAAGIAAVNAAVAVRRLPETNPSHRRAPAGPEPARRPAGVGRLVVLAFLALAPFSAFEATFSLFGARRLGLHLAGTGAVFAGVGLLIVAVQGGLVHPVTRRLGEEATIRLGLGADLAGLVVLAFSHGYLLLIPALVCLTVGQGLLIPTLAAGVAARAGGRRVGGALGYQQAASGLARIVGPTVGGVLFARAGVGSPYLAGAVVLAAALGVARRLPGAGRSPGAPPEEATGAGPGATGGLDRPPGSGVVAAAEQQLP